MTHFRSTLMWVATLVVASSCGGRAQPAGAPRADRETLTLEELNQRSLYSAYEAIEVLRPLWLKAAVQVYIDENHLGGAEALRMVRIVSVELIRHLDGIQATARYGRGHEGGAILVTTRAAGR